MLSDAYVIFCGQVSLGTTPRLERGCDGDKCSVWTSSRLRKELLEKRTCFSLRCFRVMKVAELSNRYESEWPESSSDSLLH